MTSADIIDLRSDTVTRPTPEMRKAMADAEVGDDVFGEDPTVARLEEKVASLLGKEAALFVTSGTMANQLAILLQTRRGDEIIVSAGAHCAWYESGAAAALAGVQPVSVGTDGLFTIDDVERSIKPSFDWYPRTSLVAFENTHNRGGGRVWPRAQLEQVAAFARGRGLAVHLDGARIWNAAVATGDAPAAIAAPFDTVSACFSKGLGAPVGSALCSTRERITAARKLRKMLGGGMRQAGVIAAGALHALDHHRDRLALDHGNARVIARIMGEVPGAVVDVRSVETNIVMIDLPSLDAERVARQAAERGVLVSVFGPHRLRAVTHLDVARTAEEGARRLASAVIAANGGCE
ncbi:MAG TPA: GntG family PLP-dependent aldolase [Polyangiaceae bacterium]|nr:GntG family PLP-dependent aldolase [Polyangiaceae bacterium]